MNGYIIMTEIDEAGTAGGCSHGVEKSVKVAHEFIVLEDAEVLTQHPVGEGLHEFGSLIAVQTSDQSGLSQLLQGGDKLAEIGGLENLDLSRPVFSCPPKRPAFRLKARTSSSQAVVLVGATGCVSSGT